MSPLAKANACFILGLLCLLTGIPLVLWNIMSPSIGFIRNADLNANIISCIFGVALSGAGWWFLGKASYSANNSTNATQTNEEE